MFAQVVCARFGRQNQLFEQNAIDREKKQDWLAERIGFELMVAFRRTNRALLAHKVRIPPVCGKRRVQTKNRADWTV
jgi:hypothetical protein